MYPFQQKSSFSPDKFWALRALSLLEIQPKIQNQIPSIFRWWPENSKSKPMMIQTWMGLSLSQVRPLKFEDSHDEGPIELY